MDATAIIVLILIGGAAGLMIGLALGRARTAAADARADAAEGKVAYVEEQLAERFRALSAHALDVSSLRFLELAETRLDQRTQAVDHVVAPLKEALERVETQLRDTEAGRRAAHAELVKQVEFTRQSSEQLRRQTQTLVRALQRPEARGRWGELQLRRVVEIAGMARHCDFDEQVTASTPDGPLRPDMIVRLAGGKNIVVDSKVSLAAYLEAASNADEEVQQVRLDAHARHLREHVDRLAAKPYWQTFSPAPEFVVLFIPGEAFLAPALERDGTLLEYAMRRRVHIATPTTLITMLRTAQYAWQQAALSDNARAVFELGRELYERLGAMGRNLDGLGRALGRAVDAYNRTVGSMESRVLVTARKLGDLGLVDGDLPGAPPLEETPRTLSAPELLDSAAAWAEAGLSVRGLPETDDHLPDDGEFAASG